MLDLMTSSEKVDTLSGGRSIQGGKVYDNHGNLWGDFASHEMAVEVVKAYAAGLERGREIGRREGAATVQFAIKSALNI